MKFIIIKSMTVTFLLMFIGCTHPMRHLQDIQLGMTPDEVQDEMGDPYAVRSAKLFDTEETTMVWEYWPPFLHPNTEKVHIVFQNQQVVQWGKPGDYNTGSDKTVKEYKEQKGGR